MQQNTANQLRQQIEAAERNGLTELAAIGRRALERHEARQIDRQDDIPMGERVAREIERMAEELAIETHGDSED